MLEIKDVGKQLTSDQIVALENELRACLAKQYARFLASNNGGVPRPNIADIKGLRTSPTDVQEFFGLGLDIETSNLTWYVRNVPCRIPEGVLAIACSVR
jgi:hypothetical protein